MQNPRPIGIPESELVITVKRASGYVAGWPETFEAAEDLARRCNENYPVDPARVEWDYSLGYYLAR